jgi:fibronectin type 3 domain-containing protein
MNTAGEGANSSEVNATPSPSSPPPAPTGLTATAGNAQVSLSWSAASGATSYNVKRAAVSGGPYTTIASLAVTSYTDTGLNNGTNYHYVVSAVNSFGESANSSQISATPSAGSSPLAPTGLTATGGSIQVWLSWNASSGATGYNVKRATVSGGPYTTIASPTGTSYTDTGLNNGTTFYYVVSAVNGAGESANSSQVSATPSAGGVVTWGQATNISTDTDVSTTGTLQYAYDWNNVNTTVNGVAFTGTSILSGSTADGNLTLTSPLTAINADGAGNLPAAAYKNILASSIRDSGGNVDRTVTLNNLTSGRTYKIQVWASSSDNVHGSVDSIKGGGGPTVVVNYLTTGGGNGQYAIGTFTASGTTETLIFNANGTYSWVRFNAIQVRDTTGGGAPPAAPTGLSATAGYAQVSSSWTASAGATSYNVRRAKVSGGPYTTIATGVTTTGYTDTGLTNGTTYYYVVSAVNGAGESANSSEVSATPTAAVPSAPTGLSATAGNAQVSLSWTASAGATSYNVKQATVSGGPYATIGTGVTTTGYTNTGLSNGTTYYYVVSAVNGAGEGANSSQISATPSAGLNPITGTALDNLVAGKADVALASGGATDSADSFISGYGPGLAIDGIRDTSANPWIPTDVNISGISPDWLVVDLHKTVSLGTIVISGRYPQRGAGTYTFQYTTNASPVTHTSSWTTIGTYVWSSADPLPRSGFQFAAVPNVTGVQLVSAPNYTYNNGYGGGGWGNSIQELEAYPPADVLPPVPTGLSATPGNAQVSLSWNASSGATSYHVKRATVSGGPYATVATGVTTTNCTDTGLNNGTTYYYVVSALNISGESANSIQISATPSAGSPPPNQLTGYSLTNGVFSFILNGAVGSNYIIEVSSDLVQWTPFSTNTIPPAGWLLIVDPTAGSQQERLYRTVIP